MSKRFIKSIYGQTLGKLFKGLAGEEGQALPILLAVLGLGAMVIGPFLIHASTNLMSSNTYGHIMQAGYAAESGIEEAIWKLTYSDLASQIPDPGDAITYSLADQVNSLSPSVTVTRISSQEGDSGGGGFTDTYQIESRAGGTTITTTLSFNERAKVLSWQVER